MIRLDLTMPVESGTDCCDSLAISVSRHRITSLLRFKKCHPGCPQMIVVHLLGKPSSDGFSNPPAGQMPLTWQSKTDSKPITPRVRRKRQRLPSSRSIESAPDHGFRPIRTFACRSTSDRDLMTSWESPTRGPRSSRYKQPRSNFVAAVIRCGSMKPSAGLLHTQRQPSAQFRQPAM